MVELSWQRTRRYLDSLKGAAIAVVGDVMLDRYYWGSVHRVSPEAPVPVVDVEHETAHLGGAANVAMNLAGLGVRPLLVGVIGHDSAGETVQALCRETGLSSSCLAVSAERPTTTKTRIIGNNQQIARIDHEVRNYIDERVRDQVMHTLAECDDLRGIVLEDYDKGLLSPLLITDVISMARQRQIPVFVDPKRRQFFNYEHCTVFKPNRKEVSDALGVPVRTMEDVEHVGRALLDRLQCQSVLITLGAEGMMLIERDAAPRTVPTRARKVADVSGAGDTTIATLAAMVCAGASIPEAAALANVAAGHVVAEPGIVAITSDQLVADVAGLAEGSAS
ncbi:MAG: D-glycero-beta-D-manno-heptose-7-phosphate kinase [Candidatus Kapabacteria bacterium]|nr:D-glycero-beta-D-manno-heptose-7-phosphate kinase [Candidatus Kapabacteria bacterium]